MLKSSRGRRRELIDLRVMEADEIKKTVLKIEVS